MRGVSKVLLTGAQGQLGYELQKTVEGDTQLIATDNDTLNICDAEQLKSALAKHQPDWVINAAAYTAVDKAESDQEAAYAVNAHAPALLAQAIAEQNKQQATAIRLIHISTDFVFNGQQSTPYSTEATTDPLGVYGASKLAGEQAVLQHLPEAIIIRTAWLYSSHGNNFVKTMLRLMQEKNQLDIVYDQVGSPTWARTLALVIWDLMGKNVQGVLHCSDNGVASWYDFAIAIQEEALQLGLLKRKITLKPIGSKAYPTPAQRPAFSVMDKSRTESAIGYSLPYWRTTLRAMLEELHYKTQEA
ncbi:MAG: dTDP-4-dehydrorhamnose reductase [Proteobacteria bacterium]|nr:MAG: dTDP-4-dehydrorhamnose reductase [Pseudomonadota bacterium]